MKRGLLVTVGQQERRQDLGEVKQGRNGSTGAGRKQRTHKMQMEDQLQGRVSRYWHFLYALDIV